MTVAELLRRISSAELSEWAAYYALEPFGEERADLRSGIVAATVANASRSEKQQPYSPADFMPQFDAERVEEAEEPEEPEDPQAWRKLLQRVEAMNVAFGGRDERRRGDN